MSHDEVTYRPAFIPLFLVVFLAGTLCCAFAVLGLQLAEYRTPGVLSFSFLRLLAIVYLWAMFCAFVVVWMLSVRVTSAGLRGRTFWGNASAIDWQDVQSVSRIGVPGLRFLRVHSFNGGAPMWLPTFLRKRDEFRRRVTASVSESHPLRTALVE
jgi:hypothetical protein